MPPHGYWHDGGVARQLPPRTFVVVSGPPASGKTTLARAIAPALGLPLIAKDTIKQALMSVLPVPDIETSRMVGTASVAALYAVAAETAGAVLESVWHRSRALADLRGLPGNIVEVFCRCDPPIAARRYALRAGTRAAGHFDADRTVEELWNDEVAGPVAGGWPVIEVDTNSPVEVSPLIARIHAAADTSWGEGGQPCSSREMHGMILGDRPG
jgi:predicted kinase